MTPPLSSGERVRWAFGAGTLLAAPGPPTERAPVAVYRHDRFAGHVALVPAPQLARR